MKNLCLAIFVILLIFSGCDQNRKVGQSMDGSSIASGKRKKPEKLNPLTAEEKAVIIDKATERPFTGKYNDHYKEGIYTCKQCDAMLYHSKDKFKSGCGWPSFDEELPGMVKRIPDADGMRTEIVCATCDGHLGHVFAGERLTKKNLRHCVNSISMNFISIDKLNLERAIFAGGCFWGVEYYLQQKPGVITTSVGYIGGHKDNPKYREVCNKTTGHIEAVEVLFDPNEVTYEELTKLFFEIHDPTQVDRQGPDVGEQYRSEIFYTNDAQKQVAEKLIKILKEKNYKVATKLTKATKFWHGEDYHQDYYKKKKSTPYCHNYTKKF